MSDRKKLKIVIKDMEDPRWDTASLAYLDTLNAMLIAESNLIKAGKDSALPHFIAIVKELEKLHNFEFQEYTE